MIQFQRNFRRGGCNFSPILLFSKIIPRQIFDCYELNSIELHGFSDASLQGYGAVLYVKAQAANGSTSVKLSCAKNRVAPLKVITLPRLELLGALLLARLINKTIDSLNINICPCFLWTVL
jgi:hypothetical protein